MLILLVKEPHVFLDSDHWLDDPLASLFATNEPPGCCAQQKTNSFVQPRVEELIPTVEMTVKSNGYSPIEVAHLPDLLTATTSLKRLSDDHKDLVKSPSSLQTESSRGKSRVESPKRPGFSIDNDATHEAVGSLSEHDTDVPKNLEIPQSTLNSIIEQCEQRIKAECEVEAAAKLESAREDHEQEIERLKRECSARANMAEKNEEKVQKKLMEELAAKDNQLANKEKTLKMQDESLKENETIIKNAFNERTLLGNLILEKERLLNEKNKTIEEGNVLRQDALTFAENLRDHHDQLCGGVSCIAQMQNLRNALNEYQLASHYNDNFFRQALSNASAENAKLDYVLSIARDTIDEGKSKLSDLSMELKEKTKDLSETTEILQADDGKAALLSILWKSSVEMASMKGEIWSRTREVQALYRLREKFIQTQVAMEDIAVAKIQIVYNTGLVETEKLRAQLITANRKVQRLKVNLKTKKRDAKQASPKAKEDWELLRGRLDTLRGIYDKTQQEKDALKRKNLGLFADIMNIETLLTGVGTQMKGVLAALSVEQKRSWSIATSLEQVLPKFGEIQDHHQVAISALNMQVQSLETELNLEQSRRKGSHEATSLDLQQLRAAQPVNDIQDFGHLYTGNNESGESSASPTSEVSDKAEDDSNSSNSRSVSTRGTAEFEAPIKLASKPGDNGQVSDSSTAAVAELFGYDSETATHSTSSSSPSLDIRDPEAPATPAPKPTKTKAERRAAAIARAEAAAEKEKAAVRGGTSLGRKERRGRTGALSDGLRVYE